MALAALAATVELAHGPCDLRGWEARTLVDDRVAGHVRDLLVDDGGVIRWLVLELDGGRRVLLPAGQAHADRDGRHVWVPGFSADQLALLPDHDPARPLDAPGEQALLAAYEAALLRERPAPAPQSPPRERAGAGGVAAAPTAPRTTALATSGPDPRLDASTLFGSDVA